MRFPKKRYLATFRRILVATLMLLVLGMASQTCVAQDANPPYDETFESEIQILVTSPKNLTSYNAGLLNLAFDVTVAEDTKNALISEVSYIGDWQHKAATIFAYDGYLPRPRSAQLANPREFSNPISQFSTSLKLNDIPEGHHSITIQVSTWHYNKLEKIDDPLEPYIQYTDLVMATKTCSVFFTVDNTPPTMEFLTKNNTNFYAYPIAIEIFHDEPTAQLSYSIDGQEKQTAEGNITLSDLPNGLHTITIDLTDAAGNSAASATLVFSVTVASPYAFGAVTALLASVGLLFSFNHYKRTKKEKACPASTVYGGVRGLAAPQTHSEPPH